MSQSIREAVARAVAETELADWHADLYTRSTTTEHGGDCTKEAYSCPRCFAEEIQEAATAAITAFLEAAATIPDKNGRTWRMVPERVTEEMQLAGIRGVDDYYNGAKETSFEDSVAYCYRAMLAAAPKFESDK